MNKSIKTIVALIQSDITSDIENLDGSVFNGATLGKNIGGILAMVDALSNITLELDERLQKVEASINK